MLCCCRFPASYIPSVTSHASHGQAALVPLSLPTWEDSWVAHHHTDVSLFRPSMPPIVGSSVTRAFIWGCYCVCLNQKKNKKKKGGSFAIRAENNAHFLLGMEMVISPPIFGLWMTGHNVAWWDNSSLNHADQREWTNSWSYVEPVEDILIFWPFKEIWKFGFLKDQQKWKQTWSHDFIVIVNKTQHTVWSGRFQFPLKSI